MSPISGAVFFPQLLYTEAWIDHLGQNSGMCFAVNLLFSDYHTAPQNYQKTIVGYENIICGR